MDGIDNVSEISQQKTIEEEACAWLVRLEADVPPDEADKAALAEWLNQSPLHRQELTDAAEHWNKLNILTELRAPVGKPHSGHELRQGGLFWPLSGLTIRSSLVTAMALMVVISIGFSFWGAEGDITGLNGQYITAVGQQQTLELTDGSSVRLNTDTQLRVEYSEHYRDLYLSRGEAYFDVAKNPRKPFRVFADGSQVQAIGTAFVVFVKPSRVDITVAEGKVAVLSGQNSPDSQADLHSDARSLPPEEAVMAQLGVLQGGEAASVIASAEKGEGSASLAERESVDPLDMQRRLAWRKGFLVFEGEPLAQVVEEISRYADIDIVILNPDAGSLRVGGQLPIDSPRVMVDSLKEVFGLEVRYVNATTVQILPSDL